MTSRVPSNLLSRSTSKKSSPVLHLLDPKIQKIIARPKYNLIRRRADRKPTDDGYFNDNVRYDSKVEIDFT